MPGLARPDVDFLEGRLRGRAVLRGDRTLRGDDEAPQRPAASHARARRSEERAARAPRGPSSWRCFATPTASARRRRPRGAQRDLRAAEAATAGARRAGAPRGRRRLDPRRRCPLCARSGDRARRRRGRARPRRGSRSRTCPDAELRGGVRDRPRAGIAAPPGAHVAVLDDETRRDLDGARGARLQRPDPASRDRYLFYTACTRPRRLLTLVREAATDDGSPREASPFWEAVCELFDADDVRRHTIRRPLARLTWPIESAPTERERLRALARLAADDPREADALAYANGWQRKLGRARRAFSRPTALRHPRAVALLASRETFRVTDLERMAGCSSAWFIERYLRPGEIDQAIDPRMRGSIAHVALQRFYSQLPSAIPGAERVTPDNLEAAVELMHRCVDSALDSGLRIDADDLQRRELGQGLRRDLEQLVRADAAASSTFVPRKLEVVVQGVRARARVSRSAARSTGSTPIRSARGGSSSTTSPARLPRQPRSTTRRACRSRCISSCSATSSASSRWAASTCRSGGRDVPVGCSAPATTRCPGFAAADYLEGAAFEAEIDHARETAVELAGRIRAGDVAARSSWRRLPGVVRPLAHVPQGASMSTIRSRPALSRTTQQAAAIEARGSTFVSAGAGTGKTTVLVERFARAVVARRARRRLAARHHLHGSCRRRAARADPRPPGRAGAARSRARPRRRAGSRRSTASAGGCSPRTRSPPASIRDSVSSTRHRPGCSKGRPSLPRWRQFCAVDEPDRWQLLATYRARGPAIDARERLRHPALGGARARARAGRAREPRGRGSRSWSPRQARSPPTSRRRSCSGRRRGT